VPPNDSRPIPLVYRSELPRIRQGNASIRLVAYHFQANYSRSAAFGHDRITIIGDPNQSLWSHKIYWEHNTEVRKAAIYIYIQ